MTITVLSQEIVNQIAAGEVIENPAAVVKELVENAIDANANVISISLEDSGLKKIVVKDNGFGMDKKDLLKAPLRHATSKIKSFEDLYSITSMGFRGEALASIFSIANTSIQTKQETNSTAFKLTSQNPDEIQETGHTNGTTITVEDLFFNTPARKKYLKSHNVELKSVIEVVKRIALANTKISFELNHNGKQVFEKPIMSSLEENVVYVLGKETKGKLLEVNYKDSGIFISGFVLNPTEISYSYKKNQFFFVNDRFVKSKLLSDALYEGFGSNLMVGKHPSFVLFVSIDPEIIDVNVHPTKVEIRFENEAEIFEIVRKSIKEIFETNSLFKPFEEKDMSLEKEVEISTPIRSEREKKSYFTPEYQKHFEVEEEKISFPENKIEKENYVDDFSSQRGPLAENLDEYNILGQLDKTYIVVETKAGMLLVDQHVAEEKFLYERMLYDKTHRTYKKQQLLKPYIIQLDVSEMQDYYEHRDLLTDLGFDHEPFGKQEVVIRSVPITLGHKINHPERFKEILYSILANKSIRVLEEEHHGKIASIACRSAVMAGDELTYPQMKKMIENLKYLKQPFQCPHGRPTFLMYDFKDLQKKFKRIV